MKINVNMLRNVKHVTKILRNKKTGDNSFYVIMLNMIKNIAYSKELTFTNVTDKKL
jgi:hypothetical protein